MKLVIDTPRIRAYEGNAEDWAGTEHIDLVFTNPYGYLPKSLWKHPMIIHQWLHRRFEAEEWCGNILRHEVSRWNKDREVFWTVHIPDWTPIDLRAFRPEPGGWYPEDLVRRIFDQYIPDGSTVWDGFMGRGTIAKIAREHGCQYVGVEQLPAHIALAKKYLEIDA